MRGHSSKGGSGALDVGVDGPAARVSVNDKGTARLRLRIWCRHGPLRFRPPPERNPGRRAYRHMKRNNVRMRVAIVALTLVVAAAATVRIRAGSDPGFPAFLPNNFPHLNPSGLSATFSTRGFVDLTGEYFQAQGTNGRSCVTCHLPQEAWSITPGTISLLF